jgi:hypothetical protein
MISRRCLFGFAMVPLARAQFPRNYSEFQQWTRRSGTQFLAPGHRSVDPVFFDTLFPMPYERLLEVPPRWRLDRVKAVVSALDAKPARAARS